MSIPYALFPNTLTSTPDDYMAAVQPRGTADLEMVAQRMTENGSVLANADILALLEAAITTTTSLLLEGNSVLLGGLCELVPSIRAALTMPRTPLPHPPPSDGSFIKPDTIDPKIKEAALESLNDLKDKPNIAPEIREAANAAIAQ